MPTAKMNRSFGQFKGFFIMLSLLILSTFLVYYIPAAINRILFLGFLVATWRSRKDYFWFAFLFILVSAPGGLFSGGSVYDPYRLPIYNIAPGISFAFEEIFLLTLLLKGITGRLRDYYKSFIYREQYKVLAIYFVLLLLVSFALGVSLQSFRYLYKLLIWLSLLVSLLIVFKKEEDVTGFFGTVFPFAIIALMLQIYGMTFHKQLFSLLKPGATLIQGALGAEQMMRPIEMPEVLLCCFFGSFLYIDYKKGPFNRYFLILISIISYISIILTATRSWFLGFSSLIIYTIVINRKKLARNAQYVALGVSFYLAIMAIFPPIKSQSAQAWERLRTIDEIARGEIVESSMRDRAVRRTNEIMTGFNKSTIVFGAGFSDLFYEYRDRHIGFQSILLNTGVVGLLLFLWLAMSLYMKPLRVSRKIYARPDIRPVIRNLPLLIPAFLAINSGTQFWGYDVDGARIMLLACYISISNVYLNAYRQSP